MSHIFQEIIDSIKQVAKDSGHFQPLFAKGDSDYLNIDGYYEHINDNYEEAITLYTEALKIYPENPNARDNRARAYTAKEDYDNALADVNYLIRITPYNLNCRSSCDALYNWG